MQKRNDGVDKVKSMLRKEFGETMVPIQHSRDTVQTGMTNCGVVVCMCVCVYVYVCVCVCVCRLGWSKAFGRQETETVNGVSSKF